MFHPKIYPTTSQVTTEDELQKQMKTLILESLIEDEKWTFDAPSFFGKWFKEHGLPLYFLFRRNLAVTNIQFGELNSLLQTFTFRLGERADLLFVSQDEFYSSFGDTVNAYLEGARKSGKPMEPIADVITERYGEILSKTVVIEAYFGSAAVFLPPGLEVDLAAICGYSGYIHSCGHNVYIRQVKKTKKKQLWKAIKEYRKRHADIDDPLTFAVYSHEDFDAKDKAELKVAKNRNGLTDVKLYSERFYMQNERLADIVERMREKYDGKLEIPDDGDARDTHARQQTRRNNTLWLLRDHGLQDDQPTKGSTVYYICYNQLYYNGNPFLIFDENKPAWIERNTIPHMLMAAMINLTRPTWTTEQVRLADPFVGTGTTVFEALKYQELVAECSDWSDWVKYLTEDNKKIFVMGSTELDETMGKYSARCDELVSRELVGWEPSTGSSEGSVAEYLSPEGHLMLLPEGGGERVEANPETLRNKSLSERLAIYTLFRAVKRHIGAAKRGVLKSSFEKEKAQLLAELKELRLELEVLEGAGEEVDLHRDTISVYKGRYSRSVTIAPATISARWDATPDIKEQVLVEEFPEEELDLIVADPPYGFNTDESPEKLGSMYAAMIPRFVNALRKGGSLVLCLQEESFLGRRSLAFTRKEVVAAQVLQEAARYELQVLHRSVPPPRDLFRPPFYWRSEKALARSIVHFWLSPKKKALTSARTSGSDRTSRD